MVVGGIKQAKRRSSSSYASTAFAIATCAADNPVAMQYHKKQNQVEDKTKSLEYIISTAATMRVLNVLRFAMQTPNEFNNRLYYHIGTGSQSKVRILKQTKN